MPKKDTSLGYVFYNKQRKCFCTQYGEYNPETRKIEKKTKNLKNEEDVKKYLKTIMYQKGNELFIEHNGIPLCEFMKSNLKNKLDSRQITLTQYGIVMRTIEQIEKC